MLAGQKLTAAARTSGVVTVTSVAVVHDLRATTREKQKKKGEKKKEQIPQFKLI